MVIWKLLEKLLGKQRVRTQSIVYSNTTENKYATITFKRVGNVVEVFCCVRLPGTSSFLKISSDFKGTIPEWAYPDINLVKTSPHIYVESDIKIEGYSMIQFYSNGGLTLLALNNSNDSTSYTNQFTYIVDDSDTEYELGDVDGNGTINEADLYMIQAKIMDGMLSEKQEKAADMDKDREITSSDYVLLKNQLGL